MWLVRCHLNENTHSLTTYTFHSMRYCHSLTIKLRLFGLWRGLDGGALKKNLNMKCEVRDFCMLVISCCLVTRVKDVLNISDGYFECWLHCCWVLLTFYGVMLGRRGHKSGTTTRARLYRSRYLTQFVHCFIVIVIDYLLSVAATSFCCFSLRFDLVPF